MKKFLSLLTLGALVALPFAGCTTVVGVRNPQDTNGRWSSLSGTLTVRYPQSTVEDVFVASKKALDQIMWNETTKMYMRTGETLPRENDKTKRIIVYARGIGDVKVTVTIYTAVNAKTKEECTQAEVSYGSGGNLKESQVIVEGISQNL